VFERLEAASGRTNASSDRMGLPAEP